MLKVICTFLIICAIGSVITGKRYAPHFFYPGGGILTFTAMMLIRKALK